MQRRILILFLDATTYEIRYLFWLYFYALKCISLFAFTLNNTWENLLNVYWNLHHFRAKGIWIPTTSKLNLFASVKKLWQNILVKWLCQKNLSLYVSYLWKWILNVPYLNSWKGRYKIPHPTGMYVFLPRAPKAQGEEILVHSHGVRCFIPPRPTVEVRHSWPVHPTADIFLKKLSHFE